MSSSTVFIKPVLKTKKQSRAKLIFLVLRRIIRNNPKLFFFCSLLAIISAIINYNIGTNLRDLVRSSGSELVWSKTNFKFGFRFFNWQLFGKSLKIWEFIVHSLILIFIVKAVFSLTHYYWMNYAYDKIEKDLKKDLFHHLVQAKYSNSTEVSRNLVTQFASDLDEISYDIWFIPNRLIYASTSLFFLFKYGLREEGQNGGIIWPFVFIALGLFTILIVGVLLLFKKAAKLNVAAKKRQEEDNKMIYERVDNLEYVKAFSGEKYDEEKISQQLDSTFQKNKKSLWHSTLFKVIPNYLIIPNIPIFFCALALVFCSGNEKMSSAFVAGTFFGYFFVIRNIGYEVDKITTSLLNLDDLSSSLVLVNESVKALNRGKTAPNLPVLPVGKLPFVNGDIAFQNVVFAYPKRPHQDILQNFNFCFARGKSYGIAGKNGIGKSTVIKTTLKLYDLKKGQILVGEQNIQEINTASLHQSICYQTNRPAFFRMSIAENVFYPYKYQVKDYPKLVHAAKKVGILEFVEKLTKGFDTELKERGGDLSEGQKQQIMAMRIFICDYDIYFFDEILSNVHPILKKTVLQNIFTKVKGKTILVIDHHYEIFNYVDYVYQFTGKELVRELKEKH